MFSRTQLTTDKCLGVFHISSGAQFVSEYVSKKGRKKEISDLKAATSSLSFIKPLWVFFPPRTLSGSQAKRSGYSGWCYSRCGVVEVSMLWPCYPGKKESIRHMQGEEETLYQKHISPRGCISAATLRCAHIYTHALEFHPSRAQTGRRWVWREATLFGLLFTNEKLYREQYKEKVIQLDELLWIFLTVSDVKDLAEHCKVTNVQVFNILNPLMSKNPPLNFLSRRQGHLKHLLRAEHEEWWASLS